MVAGSAAVHASTAAVGSHPQVEEPKVPTMQVSPGTVQSASVMQVPPPPFPQPAPKTPPTAIPATTVATIDPYLRNI